MRIFKVVLLVLSIGAFAATARADVKPNAIFSDNMVLQQGTPVAVFGKASPGEQVQVQLQRSVRGEASAASASGTADKDGNWMLSLGAQKAGTDYSMTVSGDKNKVEFKNVAVGEVWICSGQSNMEWSVNAGENPEKVKAAAKNPNLRLFTVNKRTAPEPITDQGDLYHFTKWVESSPETVGNFSAVGYHFGQTLQKELGVPVGLIHTSWGGTPAEAWTSLEALAADPMLKYYVEKAKAAENVYQQAAKTYDPKKAQAANEVALEKWKIEADKAKAEEKPIPKRPNLQNPPARSAGTPGVLYNAMIHPLLNFKVRGAIWYQGESNTGKAYEYRTLLPAMIQDWRKRFNCDLPFMIVQLAPFGNGNPPGPHYAELRDAQLNTARTLPKVGLAVITDVGDEKDIHPKPKQPVGERLALAALAIEYGKKIEYSGPTLKDVTFKKNTATLTFEHAAGGLTAKGGGELFGFTALGDDEKFHPAKAVIKGDNTVVVTCEDAAKITAVRYGWVNFANPTLNLFNGAGLPATPFRTDDLPYVTEPKKK
jgi:sialate O-acetylesterase